MARSPRSGSSGDMLPLELEEFEDVSLLMDNPLQPAKQTWWQKAKSFVSSRNAQGSRAGFSRLEAEEDTTHQTSSSGDDHQILMALGYRKHLEAEDLWDLCRRDEAQVVVDTFQRSLETTMKPVSAPQGSVSRTMWRVHRAKFAWAGLIKFFHDILQLSSPLILRRLLNHLERENSPRKESVWIGVWLALLMLAVQVVQTVLVNRYFHMVMRISLHLKAQLVQMLYRKSLRITSAVKSERGIGAIVNLQSNDASKLWSLPNYLHIIWSGPFQILSIMAMLVKVLGWLPAFAGLLVTILIIPMNAFLGKYLVQFRKIQMGHTDGRVKLITEVITGVKAIKLYAWEDAYVKKITQLRTAELRQIMRTGLLSAGNRVFFSISPILIALAGFGVYTAYGGVVTASVVFPALALFQMLRFPVMMFPNQITSLINGSVALKRIQSYMESDEMDQAPEGQAVDPSSGKSAVSVKNASFSWAPEGNSVLTDITMKLKAGELVIIIGEVGQGKSSLLAGLLGELHKLSGDVRVAGAVAYTAQEPWIQNASVQKNILMNKAMVEDFYAEVISSCALIEDLQLMAAGDQTEIGEKGINLSGGQKHRVALARACYATADVYLLDDPLSAVDAHVGMHLFENCLMGMLKNTTRVLVTHQLQYLPHADRIILLKNGRIVENDTYERLKEKGVKFDEFKLKKDDAHEAENEESDKIAVTPTDEGKILAEDQTGLRNHENVKALLKKISMTGKSNLTKPEERAVGNVKRSVYTAYIRNWGPGFVVPVLLACTKLSENGFVAVQNWWLSVWSHGHKSSGYYMTVYFMLGLASVAFTLMSALLLIYGLINASRKMHSNLLKKVVRMPMSFFDTQPSGRLINRFSKDTEALDSEVAPVVSMAIGCFMSVLVSVLVVIGVAWGVFIPLALLGVFYVQVQRQYLATTRELKRLDSLARSPIFGQFSETLAGLQTIRASRLQKDFSLKNELLVDLSNRAQWPLVSANRWLSMHLEIMSSSIVFFTALMVAVFVRQRAGLAGLALTSALNFTGLMNWMIRQVTQLEVSMNCVERLVDYNHLESEKAAIVEGNRPPRGWPMKGAVVVTNMWVRYRPDLDPVLKGLTFSIKPREKIGVCGRTGCGKSTLMLAIFRIMELEAGSIRIDDVDISKIGLQDLRRNLCLVPQDPVIFCGSVRMNLDPFDTVTDDSKIWEALRQAHLSDFVQTLEGGLDAQIAEGGGNLSSGQRQLLCMARALLRGSRILILDEATSNVDNTTDSVIQETIRTAFKQFTVFTIAHRLHTILDYDRVMVLDSGELKEFDSPKNLLSRPGSMFSKLVKRSSKKHEGGNWGHALN